jgi:hypothetical protein
MRFQNVPCDSLSSLANARRRDLETRRRYLRSFKFTFTRLDDVGKNGTNRTHFLFLPTDAVFSQNFFGQTQKIAPSAVKLLACNLMPA